MLSRGVFILGQEVETFEREFSEWLGVPHAIGVASGTEAIALALMALGVGPGDDVITAANTCPPTAAGIALTGAAIRLADCDRSTLMISTQSVEERITPRTRAVVPVHLYGSAADMMTLRKMADDCGFYIVEDCAQAVGTSLRGENGTGRPAGAFGDAAAFSFYPTKNLGAYGDGGCVVTSNPDVANRVRMLRNYGYTGRDVSGRLGLNSRLDELQAAFLRVKLPYVRQWNGRRERIAAHYVSELAGTGVEFPTTPGFLVRHAFHIFPILVDDRDGLRAELSRLGITTLVHYPLPLHLQPALKHLEYESGQFPNAEWACSHVLSLPIFPQLEDREIAEVTDQLRRALQR